MMRKLRMPSTLVLLFAMMVLALVATWLLPQGRFETQLDAKGHELVVPGTYTPSAERVWISPLALFTVVPRALGKASDIVFFVLLVGGAIAVLRATGAIDAALGKVLRLLGGRPTWLVGIGMVVFAAASGAIGVAEEYIPFTAMLVALCLGLRMDAMVAIGTMVCGYAIGYGCAALNPFTVLVAQGVAGLPPTSGMAYRLVLFAPFVALGVLHVWRYAQRVRRDPSRSLLADLPPVHAPPTEYPPLDGRRSLVLGLAVVTLAVMSYGIVEFGWYLEELGALFVALALVAGLCGGLSADGVAKRFTEGAAELAGTALLIGFARSVALLLEDGQLLHTVVHALSGPLQSMGPDVGVVGMLLLQTLINFFIPSGSGQAFVTMPVMAPLADVVGISRQTSVLAFQMGDGFSNMIVPTNVVLMSILGIAGIPFARWLRFVVPLMLQLLVAGAAALVIANKIGYQ